jgi:hypothetical protein
MEKTKSYNAINIIVSVVLISTFIPVFFFTYVSSVEKKIVKKQLENIVDELMSEVNMFLNDEQRELMKVMLNSMEMKDLSKEDKMVEENNNKLKKKSAMFFAVLIAIASMIVGYLYFENGLTKDLTKDRKEDLSVFMKEIIGLNIVMLGAVALSYFLFIRLVVSNYGIVDSIFIKHVMLKRMKSVLYG